MKLIVHGLGRMGMQIARKLAEGGHEVIALNRSPEPVDTAAGFGCKPAHSNSEALNFFTDGEQIIVWLMLPDDVTDEILDSWIATLAPGSIIVNGANNDYRITKQQNERAKAAGITLVDIGVSGGIWGYENGFPLMVGCDDEHIVNPIKEILDTLAAPGGAWGYFGPSGAGNYVKMVHNAIEYGMMQSLAEGYRLLHEGPYGRLNAAKAGDVWQHHSVITSWLNDLTRMAVTENPNLEGINGYVAENGEARWALETARSAGMELPAIQAAFDVRVKSQQGDVNYATKLVAAQRNKFGGHNLNGEGAA